MRPVDAAAKLFRRKSMTSEDLTLLGKQKGQGSALRWIGAQADFDSAIRRFDPSRPSQPVTRPWIVVNFSAKALQFAVKLCIFGKSPRSQNRQPWRESPESLK